MPTIWIELARSRFAAFHFIVGLLDRSDEQVGACASETSWDGRWSSCSPRPCCSRCGCRWRRIATTTGIGGRNTASRWCRGRTASSWRAAGERQKKKERNTRRHGRVATKWPNAEKCFHFAPVGTLNRRRTQLDEAEDAADYLRTALHQLTRPEGRTAQRISKKKPTGRPGGPCHRRRRRATRWSLVDPRFKAGAHSTTTNKDDQRMGIHQLIWWSANAKRLLVERRRNRHGSSTTSTTTSSDVAPNGSNAHLRLPSSSTSHDRVELGIRPLASAERRRRRIG